MRFPLREIPRRPVVATIRSRDAYGRVTEQVEVKVDKAGYFELDDVPKYLPLYGFAVNPTMTPDEFVLSRTWFCRDGNDSYSISDVPHRVAGENLRLRAALESIVKFWELEDPNRGGALDNTIKAAKAVLSMSPVLSWARVCAG